MRPLALVLLGLVVAAGLLLALGQGSRFEVSSRAAIEAPADRVWEVLATTRDWPRWWPGLEQAVLDGPLAAGSRLQLVLKGNPERSVALLQSVKPCRELSWQRPGVLGSDTVTLFQVRTIADATEVTMTNRIHGSQALMARVTGADRFAAYQHQLLAALATAARTGGGSLPAQPEGAR